MRRGKGLNKLMVVAVSVLFCAAWAGAAAPVKVSQPEVYFQNLIFEDEALTLNLADYYKDPDGTAISFTGVNLGTIGLDTSWFTLSTNGLVSGTPKNEHVGTYSLYYVVKDGNNEELEQEFDLIVRGVNDAPVITIPAGTQNVAPGSTLSINTISIADVDAGINPIKVMINATQGTITLAKITGLTFDTGTGTNDILMLFTGKLADINAAIKPLSYKPNFGFVGNDTLTINVKDQGWSGSEVPVTEKSDVKQITISVSTVVKGDVFKDNAINLKDIITALFAAGGMPLPAEFSISGDVNGDGDIGMPEALYDAAIVSGKTWTTP